jgi:hypothetical protein
MWGIQMLEGRRGELHMAHCLKAIVFASFAVAAIGGSASGSGSTLTGVSSSCSTAFGTSTLSGPGVASA